MGCTWPAHMQPVVVTKMQILRTEHGLWTLWGHEYAIPCKIFPVRAVVVIKNYWLYTVKYIHICTQARFCRADLKGLIFPWRIFSFHVKVPLLSLLQGGNRALRDRSADWIRDEDYLNFSRAEFMVTSCSKTQDASTTGSMRMHQRGQYPRAHLSSD